MTLREEAQEIISSAIKEVLPDQAVREAIKKIRKWEEPIVLVSVGKAAWQMASTAEELLGDGIWKGICITKYGHVMGQLKKTVCLEAGHPIPDENSYRATSQVLDFVESLPEKATILFLLSGGGSALFEKPLLPETELEGITAQLLACGAGIHEINTLRKRFSAVKGGKFARICAPRKVFCIVLSDVLGNDPSIIASGPACADGSTEEEAHKIVNKYGISLSSQAKKLLDTETPKQLDNVELYITGSVKEFCLAAARKCEKLGYETVVLTDSLDCEAKEAGRFLGAIARSSQMSEKSLAFIVGGETVVHVKGKGLGGRNQELVLSAAQGIQGLKDTAVFSVGSDGTDGPTDAAGGYCDEHTAEILASMGLSIDQVLERNDSYHALKKAGGLIVTGPTGTNVNDVSVLLIRR